MNEPILQQVQEFLEKNVDPRPARSPQSFFKEEIRAHGVKTALVERMSADFFQKIKGLDKAEILELCEALFRTDYMEESFVACNWAYAISDQLERDDFSILERWMSEYVNNWAKCDTLCNHTVAALVEKFPDLIERLKSWTTSGNRWMRRGSAVTLVLPARKGKFLRDVMEIADALLLDKDDLVQKGYGWMLKEAGKLHQREVFDYIMERKAVMPRTALRYAIEKMPEELRKKAMAR